METGEARQPTALEAAKSIAMKKGAERHQRVSRRIRGLFRGIKEKITHGVDFAFGSPDAAIYLGKEAVEFGGKKAEEARDAVVEAGVRTWERLVDTKDRLAQRATDATNRLVTRYEQTRDATKAKVTELSTRAAIWGLTKIAEPIEDRLQRVYEIPADIKVLRAKGASAEARIQRVRARLVQRGGEGAVQTLQTAISWIQEATGRQVEAGGKAGAAALAKAEELENGAAARREQAANRFGRARAAVKALETK